MSKICIWNEFNLTYPLVLYKLPPYLSSNEQDTSYWFTKIKSNIIRQEVLNSIHLCFDYIVAQKTVYIKVILPCRPFLNHEIIILATILNKTCLSFKAWNYCWPKERLLNSSKYFCKNIKYFILIFRMIWNLEPRVSFFQIHRSL